MRNYLTATLVALGLGGAVAPVTAVAQEPLLGQMLTVGFNFCPRGWAKAEGQIMPINSNQSLYSLLGTTYGGDGRTTFALPDLRGRVNVGVGDGYDWGQKSGSETVTLNQSNLAGHSHTPVVRGSSAAASVSAPGNAFLGSATVYNTTGSADARSIDGTVTMTSVGGGQGFDIRMPYETVLSCIAITGLFPSRN